MRFRFPDIWLSFIAVLMAVSFPLPGQAQNYPTDPTSGISWSGNTVTVADIQAAFNGGRTSENIQLGTSLPGMVMPTQSEWDAKSNSEKTLWLMNSERVARGVLPLEGVDPNVISVAQNYANYLLANNVFDHMANGQDPWQRLDSNPGINGHHDSLGVSENIYAFVTSGTSIAMPVERAVYGWIFDDAASAWGHRHAALWIPFINNHGVAGSEGLIGLGRASGGPWSGFGTPWNFAEIVVFNVFDPDSTYSGPDTDGDGIADTADNCRAVANPDQIDADGDGYGNRCDGDLNNNGATNAQDFAMFRAALGTANAAADLNGNGIVNTQDYGIFRTLLGAGPGPSGLHP